MGGFEQVELLYGALVTGAVGLLYMWIRGVSERLRETEKQLYHANKYIEDRRTRDRQLWECLNEIKQRLTRIEENMRITEQDSKRSSSR